MRRWLAVSVLSTALVASAAAWGDPLPPKGPARPVLATLRVVEGAPAEVRASAERFAITRRLAWQSGVGDAVVYTGAPESGLKVTLRAEGSAASELVRALLRASTEDEQLGRPPMVAISLESITFRGVLSSVTTSCDGQRCDADVVMLHAERALTVLSSARQDIARSPGF